MKRQQNSFSDLQLMVIFVAISISITTAKFFEKWMKQIAWAIVVSFV